MHPASGEKIIIPPHTHTRSPPRKVEVSRRARRWEAACGRPGRGRGRLPGAALRETGFAARRPAPSPPSPAPAGSPALSGRASRRRGRPSTATAASAAPGHGSRRRRRRLPPLSAEGRRSRQPPPPRPPSAPQPPPAGAGPGAGTSRSGPAPRLSRTASRGWGALAPPLAPPGSGRGRAPGAAVKSLPALPRGQSAGSPSGGWGQRPERRAPGRWDWASAMLENGSLRNCCDPGGRSRFGLAEREAAGAPRPAWVVTVLSSVLIFTTVVDILGNLLVIVSVFKNRKLRNSGKGSSPGDPPRQVVTSARSPAGTPGPASRCPEGTGPLVEAGRATCWRQGTQESPAVGSCPAVPAGTSRPQPRGRPSRQPAPPLSLCGENAGH